MIFNKELVSPLREVQYRDTLEKPDRAPYAVVPDFLTPEECEEIINRITEEGSPWVYKIDHAYGEHATDNISSRTFFLDLDKVKPLHDKVFSLMMNVNDQNFRFPDLFAEDALFVAEYQEGDFRGWHMDGGYADEAGYFNDIQKRRYMSRVLTCSIQLTNPKDYRGGNLELFDYHNPKEPERLKQGSAIIFPSHFWHRVKKVTDGTRYSLLGFMYSDTFM